MTVIWKRETVEATRVAAVKIESPRVVALCESHLALQDMLDAIERAAGTAREGAVHRNGQSTERRAAREIKIRSGSHREAVLIYIRSKEYEGTTDDELKIHFDGRQAWPPTRRTELVTAGLVKDSGSRRITSNGSEAIVWVATEFAPLPLSAVLADEPTQAQLDDPEGTWTS